MSQNLRRREPEPLRLSLAVQPGQIIIMGGGAMLRFAVRQEAPYLFWTSFDDDQQVAPSVVTKHLPIVLLHSFVGVQDVIHPRAIHRELFAPNYYVHFTPRHRRFAEVFFDARNSLFECLPRHLLFIGRIQVEVLSRTPEEA